MASCVARLTIRKYPPKWEYRPPLYVAMWIQFSRQFREFGIEWSSVDSSSVPASGDVSQYRRCCSSFSLRFLLRIWRWDFRFCFRAKCESCPEGWCACSCLVSDTLRHSDVFGSRFGSHFCLRCLLDEACLMGIPIRHDFGFRFCLRWLLDEACSVIDPLRHGLRFRFWLPVAWKSCSSTTTVSIFSITSTDIYLTTGIRIGRGSSRGPVELRQCNQIKLRQIDAVILICSMYV